MAPAFHRAAHVHRGRRPAAAIGILCGTATALGLMRLMGSLLFGVKPIDPLTYAEVALAVAAAAVIASYIPAMRATKVDPVDALRAE